MRTTTACFIAVLITSPARSEIVTLNSQSDVKSTINPHWIPPRINTADLDLLLSEKAIIQVEYDTNPVWSTDGFASQYRVSQFRIDVGPYRYAADYGQLFVGERTSNPTLMTQNLIAVGDDVPEPNFPFRIRGIGVSSFDDNLLALDGAAPTEADTQLMLESDIRWSIDFGFLELYGRFDTISITPAPATPALLIAFGMIAARRRR